MSVHFFIVLLLSSALSFLSPQIATAAVTTEKTISEYDGFVISDIQFEGLKRIEKDAIAAKIKIKKGDKLDRSIIRQDLETLSKMGFFKNLSIEAEKTDRNQVRVVLIFQEQPAIAELVFSGNDKISTSDLKDVVKVKEWSILDENLVRADMDLIQKHYSDKGYYLTKITYSIESIPEKPDQVKLTYKIRDYDKVRVKKITFLNNKVFSDNILKNSFQETKEGSFFSFLSGSGNFKEASFNNDLQRLTYWYLDHGYVKFRYENPVITVSDDKRWMYITLYVDEGEKYDVNKIDFSGDLLFTDPELRADLKLLPSETFRISQRNADIQRLTEMYQDLGYAFVNVIPKMNTHDEDKTIDIDYQFEKGALTYIGEIRVAGNTKTHDKVIRRELRIEEGELFNGTRLRISKERVERLGYFSPGEVSFNTLSRKGRDDIVDIEINVKERSTGTLTVGAGYGSVQKFFLTTQISEINFLGKGQTISFQAQYAADRLQKSFNLGFTEPYTFDSYWSTGFDLFLVNYRIPDRYTLRKLGFDVRLGYPISDQLNAYITYKNEGQSTISKDDEFIDDSADIGILSSVVWSLVRDVRNNRFETTSGNFQRASIETAGLGGDKYFLKWDANNRFYWTIVGDLVFKNSTEYGQIRPIADKTLPPSEKYYLGGPNNMKGFNVLSLGPKKILPDGKVEPLGGSVEMFSLFELEHPLIREAGIKWVLFFDIGNSYNSFPILSDQQFTLREDAGFGIRWFSPIGPLRFEWGFPLDKKPGEDTTVFSFFIGPPF